MKTKLILASSSSGRKSLFETLQIPFEIMESEVDEEKIQDNDPIKLACKRAEAKASAVAEEIWESKNVSKIVRQCDGETVERKDLKNNKQIYSHAVSPFHHVTEKVLVVGGDTVGFLDSWNFGKPKTREEAFEMLQKLSGKTHQYVSAHTVLKFQIPNSKFQINSKNQKLKQSNNLAMEQWSNGAMVKIIGYDVSSVTFRKLTKEDIETYLDRVEYLKLAGAFKLANSPQDFVTKVEGSISNIIGISLEKIISILKEEGLLTIGLK